MTFSRHLFRRTAIAACFLTLGATAHAASATQTYDMRVHIAGLKPTTSAMLSPSSYQFPDTVVGTSVSQSFSLTNTGVTLLTLGSLQVNAPYTATSGCTGTLGAGMSCTETVTFTPTTPGSVASTLGVPVAGLGSVTASLSGNGTEANASISQGSLAFGNQQVGSLSSAQGVTLTNTGTAPLSIGSINASASYTAITNCGGTLAVNGSCNINVEFAPTATGAQSGALSITTGQGTSTVTLGGTGIANALSLNTSTLSYGLVLINTQSTSQSVVVTNNDAQAVTLGQVVAPAGTTLTQDSCSRTTLPSGSQCQVGVAMAPTVTGPLSTSVTVPNASYGTSAAFSVGGYGGNNDALIGPVYAAYANGNSVWNTANAGVTAPVGQVHFEALVANNTTSPKTVALWVAIDDEIDGLKVGGSLNSYTCIVPSQTCTSSTTLTIPPGVSRLDFLAKNNGGPASLSVTVTDQSTGTQLLNSANTSAWFWTTAAF
jgi:hypothetical protein